MKTSTSIPRIYADRHGLKHPELSEKLVGIFFSIYNELGHGFLESVLLNYLRATEIEVGLPFNFGPQAQFRRYVFENERKNPRKSA
ncbi:MAG TPA: hypothetical protein VGV15_22560 [Terriglobales bacterium]|nr:hypothetical protein [Terriglobales bacterium]